MVLLCRSQEQSDYLELVSCLRYGQVSSLGGDSSENIERMEGCSLSVPSVSVVGRVATSNLELDLQLQAKSGGMVFGA